MASKEFTAPRDGVCYICGGPFAKGEPITWPRSGPLAGQGKYQHPTCQSTGTGPASGDTILDDLARVLGERMPPQPATIDETAVRAIVAETLATHGQTIRIERKDAPTVTLTGQHRQMRDLIYWLGKGRHVHLHGLPGTGKSHAVRQAAEALGRRFFVESLAPTDTRSLLTGFKGLDGLYHRTQFREACEFGGLVALEEVDNTASALLVTHNNLLDNGTATFPDGPVKVHPDFVCVILSNTNGRGGDVLFPERRPIDAAYLDRFKAIHWEYDLALERRVALAMNPDAGEWVDYCQTLRAWAIGNRKRLIVSPRATFDLVDALADNFLPVDDLMAQVLFGRVDADLRREADAAVPRPI